MPTSAAEVERTTFVICPNEKTKMFLVVTPPRVPRGGGEGPDVDLPSNNGPVAARIRGDPSRV